MAACAYLSSKRPFVSFGLILFAIFALWVPTAHAATQTITFTFTRVVEINCDEGFGEACPNDYYPKLDIDAQGLDDAKSRFCCAHGTDFQPNWVFSRSVDTSHNPVTIHVELWDQDDLSGDDQIAITPGPRSLDILVNTNSCTWQGGGPTGALNTQSSSSGSGKDTATLYFTIGSTSPNCLDSDGDGLLDGWENNGYDANADGVVDVNLPVMGANANRKDLYLQIDFLSVAGGHTHAPLQTAIRQVVQAFANAPVSNPDGTTGIQLHIDVGTLYGVGIVTKVVGTGGVTGGYGDFGGGGNQIAEAGNTIVDWDGATGNPGTSFFTLKNLNANRNNIFRYALFVHQTNLRAATNDCTSGWSKGIPGVNFLVSLGGTGGSTACWGTDASGQSVGTVNQQAGTLMHEFGHTLGLQHGGGDGVNNKPNYLSVMNYLSQACTVLAVPGKGIPGGCDYSRINLPSVAAGLNENSLDECQGIDGGALGLGPVDFNKNATLEGASNCQPPNNSNVAFNLNNDSSPDTNGNGVLDPGETPLLSTLNGFQDWGALVYNFRTVFDFTTAGAPSQQEPDPQTIENSRAYVAQLTQPKLNLTKTGPANASPGDSLSYNVKLENKPANLSRGPAVNVVLTDTKPDLSTQTASLGTVILGATTNTPFSYTVPCSTADGTVIKNTVQAHATDLLSNPVDLSSSASTAIHAPILVLTKTATPTVNAGEAITYSIHFQNTGSGDALHVVITDTVPAGVYYSAALDQGAGPRPATAILNGDGTRTLVWNIGTVTAASGTRTVEFTARPTLLALGGTSFTNNVLLSFQNSSACAPAPKVNASASTTIKLVPLTHEHEKHRKLYWKEHAHEESAEILARIQATDQRFDGRDGTTPDGALTQPEVKKSFTISLWNIVFHHNSPKRLEQELLSLYFNLATRRLNADTPVPAEDSKGLGFVNVHDAGVYSNGTLLLPFNSTNKERYEKTREVLDEIND